MKNAIMTTADRREAGRERGSILLFALTVLIFFSGLAIFLKTVLDPQTILDAKDAERVAEADALADSGFEAYGALVAAALANSSELAGADGEAGERLVDTLNDIAEVTIEDKDGKKTGVFYTNHDFKKSELRIVDKTNGWYVRSDDSVTWHMELADGTTITRRRALSLYINAR